MEKFITDNKIIKGNMLNLMTNPIFNLFVSYDCKINMDLVGGKVRWG